jgi:acyl carrier protein
MNGTVLERLLRYLDEITPQSRVPIRAETEVFAGLIDSLALVQLVSWVEDELGVPLDHRNFDMRKEWPRVSDVAAYIVRHGRRNGVDPRAG